MSLAVLLSIQTSGCELIANGKRTVEVRKTKPKLQMPFKCYIYCTVGKEMLWILNQSERAFYPNNIAQRFNAKSGEGVTNVNGKVIGEFICDRIDTVRCVNTPCMEYITVNDRMDMFFSDISCLDVDALGAYIGFNKEGYAWHISDLVIYDKPKELSEFYKQDNTYNNAFAWAFEDRTKKVPITRPPQSWCFVEELSA